MATIEFPAPEEARTYGDFAKLFRARNPGVSFKDAVALWEKMHGISHKAFFAQSWAEPEAELIHAAYQGIPHVIH